MQYVSMDIETLGTDPETCDVIEVGAVIDHIEMRTDSVLPLLYAPPLSELPTFRAYITKPNNIYHGQPYAMWMNFETLKRIADREEGFQYLEGDCLDYVFSHWLKAEWTFSRWLKSDWIDEDFLRVEEKVVFAGKNFANFDLPFLQKLGFGKCFQMHRRCLDIGSMFFDPFKDSVPPDLRTCLERSNIQKEIAHTAVEDSLDVVRCIRYHYNSVTLPAEDAHTNDDEN